MEALREETGFWVALATAPWPFLANPLSAPHLQGDSMDDI